MCLKDGYACRDTGNCKNGENKKEVVDPDTTNDTITQAETETNINNTLSEKDDLKTSRSDQEKFWKSQQVKDTAEKMENEKKYKRPKKNTDIVIEIIHAEKIRIKRKDALKFLFQTGHLKNLLHLLKLELLKYDNPGPEKQKRMSEHESYNKFSPNDQLYRTAFNPSTGRFMSAYGPRQYRPFNPSIDDISLEDVPQHNRPSNPPTEDFASPDDPRHYRSSNSLTADLSSSDDPRVRSANPSKPHDYPQRDDTIYRKGVHGYFRIKRPPRHPPGNIFIKL